MHDGATANLGDTLTYTVAVQNTGQDGAAGTTFTDALPAGTVFVPGSIRLNGALVSDAAGDDLGEFAGGRVAVRLGTGATAGAGGLLAPGASATVSFQVTVATAGLASGATIVTSTREIAADDFFEGMFATALEPGEIITEVRFPVPEKAAYEKFIQPASRFPLVAVFVAKFADGVRVAVTGASESGVFRWTEAEAALSGGFSPGAVKGMKPAAEGLIGDLHGTPEYRAHLAGVLTGRAVAAAA